MPEVKLRQRLSQKQIRFIKEYAVHGNGAEAVRNAGYSTSSDNVVYQQASENLRKPHVASALKEEIARLGLEITPHRVQRRLDQISHNSEAAGQFGPAVRAEELLGKSIGMWVDQSLHLSGVLKDEHVQALLEVARQRQLQPVDLSDDQDKRQSDAPSDQ
jgi:hypothetical protein